MLKYIFKAKFIQWLRRNGYSKKQAGQIYVRFIENREKLSGRIETLIKYATLCRDGGGTSPFNSHLIAGAFCWDMSPQGQEYWAKIKLKVEGVEECHI